MALTNNQGLMIYCFEQIKINKDLTSRYVLFDGSLHIFKTKDALKEFNQGGPMCRVSTVVIRQLRHEFKSPVKIDFTFSQISAIR